MLRLAQFFNHSNLLVAFAAAAMCAESQLLLVGKIQFFFVLLAFSATWCAYTFLKRDHPYDNIKWKRAAATLFILNLFFVDRYTLLILSLTAIIVMLYTPQILTNSADYSRLQLRKNPLLKTISISTAWTIVAVLIPCFDLLKKDEIIIINFGIVFFSYWLLTAGLSMAGDLRDAAIDNGKMSTWPSMIGTGATKFTVIIMLLLSSFLLLQVSDLLMLSTLFTIGIYTLIACLSILFIHSNKNWHFQTSWIDGLIIIHFILVFFSLNNY